MHLGRARVGLILGWLTTACAQAPPKAAVKAQPTAPAPANPFELTVDFESAAIGAQSGLFLRVKSPSVTLPRAFKLAGDPALLRFADPRAVASIGLGGEIATLIDFDAPIDVLLQPHAESGPVMGVAHVADEAHFAPGKLGTKLQPVSPGRWQFHPSDGTQKVRCELWHVAAPVGFRILCGEQKADFTRVAPFLLGRLAKQPLVSDARLEIPVALMSALETKPSGEESGVQELNRALGKRLGASAESVAFNLNWLEQDVELGMEVDYAAANTSPALQEWIGGAKAALPEQFWQTLEASPVALAFAGTDDAMMKQLRLDPDGAFLALLKELNDNAGITPEIAERMLRAAGEFIPRRCRFTLAFGGQPWPALAKNATRPPIHGRAQTDVRSGWLLAGFAGSGAGYLASLDVLFDASREEQSLSASAKRAPRPLYVRLGKPPADLPSESTLFRLESKKDAARFAWVLPTPEWVWLLSARSEPQLLAQARRLLPLLLAPPAPHDTESEEFGREPLLAVGFSLAALKESFGDILADLDVTTLPFGGSPRVFARVTGERVPSEPSLLALNIWTRWSPAAVADLVALIRAYAERPSEAAHEAL